MPWKVIIAQRSTLQQALDKWSDEVGPIKVVAMQQSVGASDVTLTIYYSGGGGSVGAGYGSSSVAPGSREGDKEPDKDEDHGDAPECPQCGSEMTLRRRKADNKPFWGCSEFPACKGIVNIEDKPKNGNKKKKKGEVDERQTDLGFDPDDPDNQIPF